MALSKTITLPNGAAGNYIRLGSYSWDRLTREASAAFLLHTSQALAAAAPSAPLCLIAVLRLNGAKFDAYLSNAALEREGKTVVEAFYDAAKVEPLIAGGELTSISLADAANV